MRGGKTIIISKDTLTVRGIIHYIHAVISDPEIETFPGTSVISSTEEIVIIIDPNILELPAQVTLEKIYQKCSGSYFIALTQKQIPENLQPYFDLSISPSDSAEEIISKLKKAYFSNQTAPANESYSNILSDRETEVLRGVALGNTNKEIGDNLNISAHTVITHRKNISGKLGIKTIAGLAIYAVLNGVVSADELNSQN